MRNRSSFVSTDSFEFSSKECRSMNYFRLAKDAKPSEQETAFNAYLASAGVEYAAVCLGETKRDDWTADAWRVVFHRPGRDDLVLDYFTGIGHRVASQPAPDFVRINPRSIATADWMKQHVKPHKPEAAGVIHSVILDSSAADESFADWCANLGYDTDSRKALANYLACQEEAGKLSKFFTVDEREQLAELLEDY
ncbi:hypothetical protein NAV33_07420 [Pseudomonas stutzeri]|uniref:hypothetical protein n=1 Tax=Stutzerimonas stutzeri TaxID=316 RepID=UPI00210B34EB|nr:hypothetical protein [Stutzerimonas stutzeri]MCQ4311724.1 hypothetical protein [Stutzerimonas stutzeri]